MTFLRKRLGTVAAALTVAALVLAGCGDGSGSGGEGSASTPLPDEQQNLTYVPNYGVQSLDIAKFPLEIGVQTVVGQVLEPLIKLEEGKPVPHLAESFEWVDPKTLQFKLRDDVKFSDGQAFTSADVTGSLDRYVKIATGLSVIFANIESYTADDPTTVTLHLKQPAATVLGVMSMVLIGQGTHSTDDAWWSKPIGTGPFVFTEYVANDHATVVRNEEYWGEKAKLKTLNFSLITDSNAKLTALSNNQAQAVQDLTNDQLAQIEGTDGVEVLTAPSYSYYFVWFENSHTPLDDPKVRRAMFQAVDRETIQKTIFGETASVMKSYCPISAFGCLEPAGGLPTYDPENAKKLLAEAGYADGFEVDVIWNTSVGAVTNYAQALIANWKEIGVTVKPRALDATTWLAEFTALNWDMDTQASQIITGDADYVLNRLYSCAAKRLGYCNPDLDKILTQAQQSTDDDERLKLYQQAVDTMAEDLPAIPLFAATANVAIRSNVRDLVIPPTEFVNFSRVYLTS